MKFHLISNARERAHKSVNGPLKGVKVCIRTKLPMRPVLISSFSNIKLLMSDVFTVFLNKDDDDDDDEYFYSPVDGMLVHCGGTPSDGSPDSLLSFKGLNDHGVFSNDWPFV